jgi:hypothetical protein
MPSIVITIGWRGASDARIEGERSPPEMIRRNGVPARAIVRHDRRRACDFAQRSSVYFAIACVSARSDATSFLSSHGGSGSSPLAPTNEFVGRNGVGDHPAPFVFWGPAIPTITSRSSGAPDAHRLTLTV